MRIEAASAQDIEFVLPLMRDYCEFYAVAAPAEEGLREMAEALVAAPDSEGILLVARDQKGHVVGFTAAGWKWSSLRGARIVVLEDLFVAPDARGQGAAEGLIRECARLAHEHGAPAMTWMTALDNRRAQSVYERVGASAARWLEYELELDGNL